jgi:putative NADH-flavin reductase
VNLPGSADLAVVTADVLDEEMAGLLTDVDAVVSGIGIRKGDPAGTLLAGARAAIAAMLDGAEKSQLPGEIVVPLP